METIRELEAQNYHHIECRCQNCNRGTVWVPFDLIRKRRPRIKIDDLTIEQLGAKMICGQCWSRDVVYRKVRQEDALGYVR